MSKADAEEILGISHRQPAKAPVPAVTGKAKTAVAIDTAKVIAERLSSGKKREIEYLSDIQSAGLTSTINTFIETGGIFLNVNPSMKYLKNSLFELRIETNSVVLDYNTVILFAEITRRTQFITRNGIG